MERKIKMSTLDLDYLFCGQFTQNPTVLDLLEDLALNRKRMKKPENKEMLYNNVLKCFKVKNTNQTNVKSQVYLTWSSIRIKAIKEMKIKNFIIKIKSEKNFDNITIEKFVSDLNTGLNFKTINDKNIVLLNNEIDNIVGLQLHDKSYSWSFNLQTFKGKN
jgi:hypothetical protein